jgi:hypothetical protein
VGLAATEEELRDRTARFIKAELKRADLIYGELAERLERHRLHGETENSIKSNLKRGIFSATFLLATLAALELEGVSLSNL